MEIAPQRYSTMWIIPKSFMVLHKIVIYQVPTEVGDYAYYKIIALFGIGLVYPEGGRKSGNFYIVPSRTNHDSRMPSYKVVSFLL